jgi:hypothetical protein
MHAGLPTAPCVFVMTEGKTDRPSKLGVTTNLRHRFSLIAGGNHRPLIVRHWQPIGDVTSFKITDYFRRLRLRADWYDVRVEDAIAAAKEMASPGID